MKQASMVGLRDVSYISPVCQPSHPGIPHVGQAIYLPQVKRALPESIGIIDTPEDGKTVHGQGMIKRGLYLEDLLWNG